MWHSKFNVLHAQKIVHTWLLFLHLHLDLGLQARFGLLHEHLISDSNSSGAKGTPSSTTIGSIEVVPSYSFRPWSVGDTAGGSGAVAFLHTATWRCARFTFWWKDSVVGGSVHSLGGSERAFPTLLLEASCRARVRVLQCCWL